ncbi:MAG: cyclodeaminase/cyclohydrolase family protein [Proteobacteria bacterium]|nr:cyclodeaminase/cyclohydrolase family protein [Pseudomonadota bacterium]MBU1584170.1 cyclodeaminase/cyclohydrolase family protein [Pseudomonadota bacterium]MBU2453836.1 cyclodeaminase/cyclohydrolase family protein [Pseudomonadota bacterium]
MNFGELKIKDFTQEVATASPAPGGGSVAALCGALGAALCHMVAGLTLGKKKYADVEAVMLKVKETATLLEKELLVLVDEDTLAYSRVTHALKLPKKTLAQIDLRKQAIQDALKQAAMVPCKTLEKAASAMVLVELVIKKGNPNCFTDAGVAAELIAAAVQGSAYNVFVNLMDIEEDGFSMDLKQKVHGIKQDIHKRMTQLRKTIAQSINMEP